MKPTEVMDLIQQIAETVVPNRLSLSEPGLFEPQDSLVATATSRQDHTREDRVVEDEHGVVHDAVFCGRNAEQPFVVAMCEYMDAVDYAADVLQDPSRFKYPDRRWTEDQERVGITTCLACIGA